MAIEALSSAYITNRDAKPPVLTTGALGSSARVHESKGIVTVSTAATAGSTYRFCDVPSNACISQIILNAGAMTAGAFDIGVYKNTKDGGALVSQALFGAAVSCAAAVTASDVTNASGNYTITKQNQPLWQALGLAADPTTSYDIVATCTTAATVGALMGVKVRFSV